MSGWEVSHEREKPEQATGCGGGVGEGWARRKPARVTHPALLLDAGACCQKKKTHNQIPQAGLSLGGGGIISSVKWQRREALGQGQLGRADGSPGAPAPRGGGLWGPVQGGERPPGEPDPSQPELSWAWGPQGRCSFCRNGEGRGEEELKKTQAWRVRGTV